MNERANHHLEATLNSIVGEVEAVGYDRVRLYMLSADRQSMVCRAQVGMNNGFVNHARPADKDPYLQQLMENPRPHIFRRREGHSLPFDEGDGKDPQEWACIPLVVQDRVIGKLSVDNKTSGKPLVEEQLKVVSLYASRAASAIEEARWTRTLETFNKLASTVNSSLDIKEIFRRTCQTVKELFEASHSAVVLFDENYEFGYVEAEYPAQIGTVGTRLPLRSVDVEERLVKSQTPIVLEDVAAELPEGELRNILLSFDIQSLLVAPIVSRGRLIGSFSLDAIGNRRHFTAEEVNLCQTLGTQVAMAVENARRFQGTKQQLGKMVKAKRHLEHESKTRKLVGIIARVSTLGDRERTLQLIADGTLEALGCDAVTLYAYDQTKDKLDYPPKTAGLYFPEQTKVLPKMRANSIVYRMLQLDEPYLVEYAEQDEMFKHRRFTLEEKIKSVVAVPLVVAGRRTGVIFFNYRTGHRFTEGELDNIRMFADLTAVAIHNAQLFDEKTAKLNEQETLARLSQELLGTAKLEETLKRVVEVARSVLKTEYASIVLPDENGDLTTRATSGWEEGIADVYRPGNGLTSHAGYTALCVAPVRVSNYSTEMRFLVPEIVSKKGIKSGMSAPVNLVNGVTGAILVQSDSLRDFSSEEETLLRMIADETSIAVQRVQHYEDLETVKSLVVARNALAWMGMGSTHWRHDLHNVVMTIHAKIQVLRTAAGQSGTEKAIPDWIIRHLDSIESEVNRIKDRSITSPLSAEEGVEDVPVSRLVYERLNFLWEKPEYNFVVLAGKPDPQLQLVVLASPEWLRRALDILIDNAIQAVSVVEPGRRVVSVSCRSVGGVIETVVADSGCGIPDDVRERLFKGKVDDPGKDKGLGMGLLIAQAIVETYGGSIRVGSTGPTGTEMIIRLPIVRRDTGEFNNKA